MKGRHGKGSHPPNIIEKSRIHTGEADVMGARPECGFQKSSILTGIREVSKTSKWKPFQDIGILAKIIIGRNKWACARSSRMR